MGSIPSVFYGLVAVILLAGLSFLLDFLYKKKKVKSDIIEEIEKAKAPEDI